MRTDVVPPGKDPLAKRAAVREVGLGNFSAARAGHGMMARREFRRGDDAVDGGEVVVDGLGAGVARALGGGVGVASSSSWWWWWGGVGVVGGWEGDYWWSVVIIDVVRW